MVELRRRRRHQQCNNALKYSLAIAAVTILLSKTYCIAFTIMVPTSHKGNKQNTIHILQSQNQNNNVNINDPSTSFNDAFLDSLENEGNSYRSDGNSNTSSKKSNNKNNSNNGNDEEELEIDPSPDSLSSLRDLASSNVANFLASFSQPPTMDDDIVANNSQVNNYNNGDSGLTNEKKMKKDNVNNNQSHEVNGSTYPSNTSSVSSSTIATAANKVDIVSSLEAESIIWDVYVCQSKQCIERGASATLDSFQALVPSEPYTYSASMASNSASSLDGKIFAHSNEKLNDNLKVTDTQNTNQGIPTIINIHPAILSKSKSKGPNVRCIQRSPPYKAFEVNNVNDIDKVYRILTKHMSITNISRNAKDCLKYTYQGNSHLERNELSKAIQSYNMALEQNYNNQEGMILLLRATAYLKRAFQHQDALRQTVADLGVTVSDPLVLGKLYSIAEANPSLATSIFQKVLMDSKIQDKKFRLTKYRHGLYEYSLLHAAQDSLRSTQLLPHHAKTWLRAGDALAELRKLKESALYYEKAMDLDPTLRSRLEPVVERLNRSQEFLDKAKGWWSSDTLRLALDVAG